VRRSGEAELSTAPVLNTAEEEEEEEEEEWSGTV
jgi:hypothetical protein